MKPPLWPSKEVIMAAATAAADRTGAIPEEVIEGYRDSAAAHRARVYAALALREVYGTDNLGRPCHIGAPGIEAFGKMVGGHKSTLASFDRQKSRGDAPWFKDWILYRVIEAIRNALTPPVIVPRTVSGEFLLGKKPTNGHEPVVFKTPAQARSFCSGRPEPVRLVDGFTFRHKPATVYKDITAERLGDPAPERSALAHAVPWVPYEQRAKARSWRSLNSSQPSRFTEVD